MKLCVSFLFLFVWQFAFISPVYAADVWSELGIIKLDKGSRDFTLRDMENKKVSLHDLRGRVVFINFWATWCYVCRIEMPDIEKMHSDFGGRGLEVIAVNDRESKETVLAFMKENKYSFKVLLDVEGKVDSDYGVAFIPLTILIDRSGKMIGRVIGARDWSSPMAYRFIEEILAK